MNLSTKVKQAHFAVCARMTEDLTVPDDAHILGVERRQFHPDALAVGCVKDLR